MIVFWVMFSGAVILPTFGVQVEFLKMILPYLDPKVFIIVVKKPYKLSTGYHSTSFRGGVGYPERGPLRTPQGFGFKIPLTLCFFFGGGPPLI